MCFGGRGRANVKMIVFVLRLAFPSFTLMARASVTSCGPSSVTISSTLHAAISRERMTPLYVLSVRCGVTFTGTVPSSVSCCSLSAWMRLSVSTRISPPGIFLINFESPNFGVKCFPSTKGENADKDLFSCSPEITQNLAPSSVVRGGMLHPPPILSLPYFFFAICLFPSMYYWKIRFDDSPTMEPIMAPAGQSPNPWVL